MRAWEAALEHRTDLERFWRSARGEAFGLGFTRSVFRSQGRDESLAPFYNLAKWEAQALALARPVYVAAEMIEVWNAASATFPGEPLLPTDPPWESGFAWLATPRSFTDAAANEYPVRAFSWHAKAPEGLADAEPGGVVVAVYTYRGDEDPESLPKNDAGETIYEDLGTDLALMHHTPWGFGVNYLDLDHWNVSEATSRPWGEQPYVEGSIRLMADIQAFFRLVQQRIAVPSYEPASRGTRRRAGAPKREIPEVAVVNLRRPRSASSDPHPTAVEWTHRWIVDGFWRRQWYPSLGKHRLRYIAPYVKGPKDKPLVIKDKAYQWIR